MGAAGRRPRTNRHLRRCRRGLPGRARKLVRGDAIEESGLLLKEAKIQEKTGRYSDAIRWVRKGLGVLDGVAGPEAGQRRARLASWFGMIRLAQGRAKEAVTWCERAIDEAVAVGDRDAEAHACQTLDWAYVALGRRDQAVFSARALELYEELGDLSGQAGVLNNLGVFAYFVGDWDKAVDFYEQARDLELRTGNAVNGAFAAANVGEVLADQGHLDAAEGLVLEALRVFRAAHYGYMIGFSTQCPRPDRGAPWPLRRRVRTLRRGPSGARGRRAPRRRAAHRRMDRRGRRAPG